ncbi:MAG: ABC-2 family transporter protein [Methanocella sp. PtaU1.Bin125]|nr:MAG: ABC-2 family transporter protein [Methanocella sp. PtaU1.Bin125]
MYDAQREIRNIGTIATKEFRDNVGSKRFIFIGFFYLLFAVVLSLVTGYVSKDTRPYMVLGMMESLNLIVALLAVIISADTLSLEKKDRTVYQLLSKPVERSSVVIGKYLGCLAVIATLFTACALLAYALTAVFSGTMPAPGDLIPFVGAILAENLMLAAYIAIGVLVSTVTKNPFISIMAAFLAWVVLFMTSTMGNIVGLFAAQESMLFYAGDTFDLYPVYAKAMIWVDPMSHGMVSQLLSGNTGTAIAGLPLWANVAFLLGYALLLLTAAVMLFKNQDIT